jgi:hypothetical protein
MKFKTFHFFKINGKSYSNYKNTNSKILIDLYNFKKFIAKLLEEKIYHYSLFNSDTKELTNLKSLSLLNLKELENHIGTRKNNDLYINEKLFLINNINVILDYTAFIEFIRYIHERKEEDINNYLRDYYSGKRDNVLTREQKLLIKIRDEWRECLHPEILDSQKAPINPSTVLSKFSLEANKYLVNLLL